MITNRMPYGFSFYKLLTLSADSHILNFCFLFKSADCSGVCSMPIMLSGEIQPRTSYMAQGLCFRNEEDQESLICTERREKPAV